MLADESSYSSLRFDLFELDVKNCRLWRSGIPVDVPPQALRILGLLTARPDQLVTRQEIKEALWPGQSYGDFDSRVNFAVKRLREALGDSAEQPRYVQTVRNAGYTFIAPVRPVENHPFRNDNNPASNAASGPQMGGNSAQTHGSHFGRTALVIALIAVIASIVAIRSFILNPRDANAIVQAEDGSKISASAGDQVPKISSVSPIVPRAKQRIVIRGRGLGLHVPYAQTDSPYLAIRDQTADWAAGRMIPENWDEVKVDVERWSSDEIVISGFSGDYGKKRWKLVEGDELEIAVWNPQSGAGPAKFHVAVVSADSR